MRKFPKKSAVTVATPVAAAPVALLAMNMSAALDVSELTGDAALDALMAELNSVSPGVMPTRR